MTKFYIRTVESLIILGLCIMVALTFSSAMVRFAGHGGIFWAEEVTRYVSIWVVFLAAGLGMRYGIHLSMDLVMHLLPRPMLRASLLFAYLLSLVFQGVLVYYGTQLALSNHAQQSASLRIPMSYPYAAIPVGAALMMGETLRLIWLELNGRSTVAPSPFD